MISSVGQFYDGRTPVARAVQVIGDDNGLQILSAEDGLIFWDYENLREQGSDLKPDHMIVSPADDPSQFLSFENEALVELVRSSAKRNLQKNFSVTPAWAMKVWASLGAVALLVLFLMYVAIPWTTQYIAPVLPYKLEANIGQAAEDTFIDFLQTKRQLAKDDSPITCNGSIAPLENIVADLQQAVMASAENDADLAKRIDEVGMPSVQIINSPVVNAVALPGGRIFVFRGLLEKAVTDFDSVAFILSHEIAHVMYRHNMRNVIAHSAAAVLLQSLIGDLLGSPSASGIAGIAVTSSYTLEMEKQADDLSVVWTKSAGYNPAEAVTFFEYIATLADPEEDNLLPPEIANIFATHPANEDRVNFLLNHASGGNAGKKYGNYDKWLAELKESCPAPKSE